MEINDANPTLRDPRFEAETRRYIAISYRFLGNLNAATRELGLAIATLEDAPETSGQDGPIADLELLLAEFLLRNGEAQAGVTVASRAVNRLRDGGGPPLQLGNTLYFLALMQNQLGQDPRPSYLEAIALLQEAPNPDNDRLGVAHYNLGLAYQRYSDPERAAFHFGRAVDPYSRFANGLLVDQRQVIRLNGVAEVLVRQWPNSDPLAVVNATDALLKDEEPGNDSIVRATLAEIAAEETIDPLVRATAALNLSLYYMSAEEPEAARRVFLELQQSQMAQENASLASVIGDQALPMVELLSELLRNQAR